MLAPWVRRANNTNLNIALSTTGERTSDSKPVLLVSVSESMTPNHAQVARKLLEAASKVSAQKDYLLKARARLLST